MSRIKLHGVEEVGTSKEPTWKHTSDNYWRANQLRQKYSSPNSNIKHNCEGQTNTYQLTVDSFK